MQYIIMLYENITACKRLIQLQKYLIEAVN